MQVPKKKFGILNFGTKHGLCFTVNGPSTPSWESRTRGLSIKSTTIATTCGGGGTIDGVRYFCCCRKFHNFCSHARESAPKLSGDSSSLFLTVLAILSSVLAKPERWR